MTTDKDHSAMLMGLDNLVGAVDKFEKIETLLGGFNLFNATSLGRREVKHCHFLSFLLDPTESHHMGDLFLRALLDEWTKGREEGSRVALYLRDLSNTIIKKERKIDSGRRIDILAIVPADTRNPKQLVVVIEAKIDAKESENQLPDYQAWIEGQFNEIKNDHLFIFLVKNGEKPSSKESKSKFITATWSQLHNKFNHILQTKRATIHPDLAMTLDHYLRHLEREEMAPDPEEKLNKAESIAAELYKHHRLALDFIFERRLKFESELSKAICKLLEANEDFALNEYDSSTFFIRFAPKDLKDILIETKKSRALSSWPVVWNIEIVRNKQVKSFLEIPKFEPANVRDKLFTALSTYSPNAKRNNNSRLYVKDLLDNQELKDIDGKFLDSDELAKKIVAKFERTELWAKSGELSTIIKRYFQI